MCIIMLGLCNTHVHDVVVELHLQLHCFCKSARFRKENHLNYEKVFELCSVQEMTAYR